MTVVVLLKDTLIEAQKDGQMWGGHPYEGGGSRCLEMGRLIEQLLRFGVKEFTFRDERTPPEGWIKPTAGDHA